jgi:hypothetical protein
MDLFSLSDSILGLVCGLLYFIIWMASSARNILGSNSDFNNSMGSFHVLYPLLGPCPNGIWVIYVDSSLLCTSPISSVGPSPTIQFSLSSFVVNGECMERMLVQSISRPRLYSQSLRSYGLSCLLWNRCQPPFFRFPISSSLLLETATGVCR